MSTYGLPWSKEEENIIVGLYNPGNNNVDYIVRAMKQRGFIRTKEAVSRKIRRLLVANKLPPEQLSPLLCDHANENPQICPCIFQNCYCKSNTCRQKESSFSQRVKDELPQGISG